jgi:hypothetical protein
MCALNQFQADLLQFRDIVRTSHKQASFELLFLTPFGSRITPLDTEMRKKLSKALRLLSAFARTAGGGFAGRARWIPVKAWRRHGDPFLGVRRYQ